MNITLKQLTYFKALVQHRNFGRAAAACNISQPALSVQIRALETALNGPLVERQARDVVMTPFGRQALEQASRILNSVQALQDSGARRAGLSGQLSLGAIPTIAPYILPAALRALRSNDIGLDVEVTEAKTDRLIDLLHQGHIDAALMALPSGGAGLIEVPLFEDRFLLAGSAAQLGAIDVDALNPDALGNSQLMLLEDGHCLSDQALEVCRRGRGHARINTGASSLATLSRLVAAGFGLTLMPELAAYSEQAASPEMRFRRFLKPEPSRRIGLVRRRTTQGDDWFAELEILLRTVGQGLLAQIGADPNTNA